MTETNRGASEILRGVPERLALCFKLAELEREWPGVVGEEYARRSSIASCSLEPECVVITVHAADGATVASMSFLKNKLARMLRDYLKLNAVRIEIRTGSVKRPSAVRPPLPAWKRRAPVVVGDGEVARELEFTSSACHDKELAKSFARLKALVERRKNRKS